MTLMRSFVQSEVDRVDFGVPIGEIACANFSSGLRGTLDD